MQLIRSCVVLGLVTALGLVPATASATAASTPKPHDKEQREVARLFDAAEYTRIVADRPVAVEEVVALAAEAEKLQPSEALERVTGRAEITAATTASVFCRAVEWEHHRGIFPYHRWIVGYTYWCYQYGGDITYRASNTSARVDGVCSGSNERDWRISGGAGFSWVVVHHEASFSCRTPWWYTLNDTLWMEPAFNSYGSTYMTAAS
ncbi:MAG: hypothetical protein H0V45_10320 [Actinobacteria bacterium]|nr:hypothetical protein [Actinomycetota bacterium]